MTRACALAAFGLLAACTTPEIESAEARSREAAECPKLVQYNPDRASIDAAAALGRGERYLLGVYGYTGIVPGRTDPTLAVRYIEGTSDARCFVLNGKAREYARRFNEVMQAKL